jgi:hypothetical protein
VAELDALVDAPRWGSINFANADFVEINNRAHFDYQQQRVFVRTSKLLKRRLRRRGGPHNLSLPVNKCIGIVAAKCPMCKSEDLRNLSDLEGLRMRARTKRVLDLAITGGGIHRRITECKPAVYCCGACGHRFKPERYHRVAKHGHTLMSWAMHSHVAHHLSYGEIRAMFREYFGLNVNDTEIYMFKLLMARLYRSTYEGLLSKLTSGSVLHADETTVHLRTGRGYVWVFASIEDVVYMYRPSREAEFLRSLLKEFRGTLISDFFAGYDGLPCGQQKCLIHLIRDLNEAILKNPYDDGVRSMTEAFGGLLRAIVATIDDHGLKRVHLAKHDKSVRAFFQQLSSCSLRSDAAESIRDRLLKNRDKLFTFLRYDGVPWNNNNAENAIKQFAYYRESRSGIALTERGLQDYLILLSIYQTCRYKRISFLQFLLSGERDIDAFAKSGCRRSRKARLLLYPKGFTPPHLRSVMKVPGK